MPTVTYKGISMAIPSGNHMCGIKGSSLQSPFTKRKVLKIHDKRNIQQGCAFFAVVVSSLQWVLVWNTSQHTSKIVGGRSWKDGHYCLERLRPQCRRIAKPCCMTAQVKALDLTQHQAVQMPTDVQAPHDIIISCRRHGKST